MKTNNNKYVLIFASLTLIAIIALSTSCKKDTECKALITVKYLTDTNKVVANSNVTVSKYDVGSSGVTNSAGQFEVTFKNEAILDVVAVADTTSDTVRPPSFVRGTTTIRLIPGETVQKSVFVQ